MEIDCFTFASLDDAIAMLGRLRAPLLLTRFAPLPAESVVIAVNDAAAAWPDAPAAGECRDSRRDRHITADVELDYLYYQLLTRGRARQVLSIDDGQLYELRIKRVTILGDDAVFGRPACSRPVTAVTGPEPAEVVGGRLRPGGSRSLTRKQGFITARPDAARPGALRALRIVKGGL
jgi:hypothetical protein